MSDDREATYARLPADLLAQLLNSAPRVAEQVSALLTPALEQREALRQAAERTGLIRQVEAAKHTTLCAADGGFAVERTIAVDIVMAVAVGVEGFGEEGVTSPWTTNQYSSFHEVMLHDVDNERLARAAMMTHELAILADAPHQIRIYDGSHLTPVIQLNSGYSSRSPLVHEGAVNIGLERGIVEALTSFASNPQVISMPKYDSSTDIAKRLGHEIGLEIPGDDKYVTSLILRGGEYTNPQQVAGAQWAQLHLSAPDSSLGETNGLLGELDHAIDPLRRCELYFLYWRPDDAAPTYRLEIKPALAHDATALAIVLSSLAHQITGPFVREPYPQYLADVMAKSVGLGLGALKAAALLSLTRTQPELAPMLVQSYRTEGK